MNRDPLRVLVLEANDGDFDKVKRSAALVGVNFAFERTTNQVQFEAALAWGEADLILADHHVPGFEGPKALAAAAKALPKAPYIIVSGPIGEDHAADCLRSGAFDFVLKERLERLPESINRALKGPKEPDADQLQAQKTEFVGNLAGGVAHDFNNLLTIISGYVSMLLDKEGLPPASNEALRQVYTATRQATGLVRQLLLFSRKRAPMWEVVDLNSELEQMATMLGRVLGETVRVEFEASPDSPAVKIDTGMLEQALMNLANNASDAMPNGGRLTLSVGSHTRTGGNQPVRKGDFACILVKDTGSGIAPAVLPKLFTPFFTTKEEGRGMGLGLATAQDIVRRHEGWIEVESEVGAGASFRIYLPLSSAKPATSRAKPEGGSKKDNKGIILLVEDEVAVREFAAAVLHQEGYGLLQAKSGENALEVWRWHSARIDLLLTDVVLPGDLSGPQLAAKLQDEKPGLKAILATGYSREMVGEQSPQSGALVVLNKPYTPRSLLSAVKEALATRVTPT